MKRLLLFICFVINFLNVEANSPNRECIYGIGIAKTQDEADNNALISLSKAIKAEVSSSSRYSVSSENGSVNETFNKVSTISTDILVTESKVSVSFDGDNYTVKRYINKDEYVAKKTEEYLSWMNVAAAYMSIDSIRCKHVVNIILGAYYMAYTIMDNSIMDALFQSADACKQQAKDGARYVYETTLGYYSLCVCRKEWWGVMVGINNSHLGYALPGFEILDEKGQWRQPNYLVDENSQEHTPSPIYKGTRITRAIIHAKEDKNPHYRLTYEILSNGFISKIDVPKEWYFIDKKL